MEKGEIAHLEQFHHFPQCFPKDFFSVCLNEFIWRKELNLNRLLTTLRKKKKKKTLGKGVHDNQHFLLFPCFL